MVLVLLVGVSFFLGVNAAVAEEQTGEDFEARINLLDEKQLDVFDEYENVVGDDLTDLPDDVPRIVSIDDGMYDEYDSVVGDDLTDLPDDMARIISIDDDELESEDGTDETNEEEETNQSNDSEESTLAHLPIAVAGGLAGLGVIGLIFIKRR